MPLPSPCSNYCTCGMESSSSAGVGVLWLSFKRCWERKSFALEMAKCDPPRANRKRERCPSPRIHFKNSRLSSFRVHHGQRFQGGQPSSPCRLAFFLSLNSLVPLCAAVRSLLATKVFYPPPFRFLKHLAINDSRKWLIALISLELIQQQDFYRELCRSAILFDTIVATRENGNCVVIFTHLNGK